MRFTTIKQVLQFYFDEAREHTPAFDYTTPQVDGGSVCDTDELDAMATIGYYLKSLSPHSYALLYHAYRDNLSAYGIAKRVKQSFPNRFINNKTIDKELKTIERQLDYLFREVGIIEEAGRMFA